MVIDEEQITTWLQKYISDLLAVPVDKIDVTASFRQLGLDSSAAVGMTGDLSEWLHQEVDPAAAYDHPTIQSLARELVAPR